MTTVYIGQAEVARWCGVTGAAVSNWFKRYEDCPRPDVIVLSEKGKYGIRGWLPERKDEWLAFKAKLDSAPSQKAKVNKKTADAVIEAMNEGSLNPADAAKILRTLI